MSKLIHEQLSYAVRGVLFDVHNKLGPGLREEYYRDAVALGLEARGIGCQAEKAFEVYYERERVGLYYVDLWVEDGKILLELKVAPAIEPLHKAQALAYLKVTDADLAFVANYGSASLEVERLPNFLRDRRPEFAWRRQPPAADLLHPELVNQIQEACHRVHWVLGPGFLHQVYRRATMIELHRVRLDYEYIKRLPVEYQGHLLGYRDVRLILVEGKLPVATFALRNIDEALEGRVKAALRRLDLPLGLLANFYGTQPIVTPARVRAG
jgi:GxxExxY protein